MGSAWRIRVFAILVVTAVLTWYGHHGTAMLARNRPLVILHTEPAAVELRINATTRAYISRIGVVPKIDTSTKQNSTTQLLVTAGAVLPDSSATRPVGFTAWYHLTPPTGLAKPLSSQSAAVQFRDDAVLADGARLYWILGASPNRYALAGENRGIRFVIVGSNDNDTPDLSWLNQLREKTDILIVLSSEGIHVADIRSNLRPLYTVILDTTTCQGNWCDSLGILSPPFQHNRLRFGTSRASGTQLIADEL